LGIRSLVLTKIHNNADFLLFSRPDRLTPRSGRFRWCLQHIGMFLFLRVILNGVYGVKDLRTYSME